MLAEPAGSQRGCSPPPKLELSARMPSSSSVWPSVPSWSGCVMLDGLSMHMYRRADCVGVPQNHIECRVIGLQVRLEPADPRAVDTDGSSHLRLTDPSLLSNADQVLEQPSLRLGEPHGVADVDVAGQIQRLLATPPRPHMLHYNATPFCRQREHRARSGAAMGDHRRKAELVAAGNRASSPAGHAVSPIVTMPQRMRPRLVVATTPSLCRSARC